MKKVLVLIIILVISLAHHKSWSMFLGDAEELNVSHPNNSIAYLLCALEQAPNVKLHVIEHLFDGSEKLGWKYFDLSFDKIVKIRNKLENMANMYPIRLGNTNLTMEHYDLLTQHQAAILSRVTNEKIFYKEDVDDLHHSFRKLQQVNPKLLENEKNALESCKLYPSLEDRIALFLAIPGRNAVRDSLFVGGPIFLFAMDSMSRDLISLFDDFLPVPACKVMWVFTALCGLEAQRCHYYEYKHELETVKLPTQPNLLDVLSKRTNICQ